MTKIEGITGAIIKELQKYTNMVTEEVEEAKIISSKEFKADVEKDSPKDTGSYKKGWRIKKDAARKSYIIHNKTDYQLTHLLENGFVMRNGKRKGGITHIRNNEEKMIANYLKRINKAVKQ